MLQAGQRSPGHPRRCRRRCQRRRQRCGRLEAPEAVRLRLRLRLRLLVCLSPRCHNPRAPQRLRRHDSSSLPHCQPEAPWYWSWHYRVEHAAHSLTESAPGHTKPF
jgi:hypothetical protein